MMKSKKKLFGLIAAALAVVAVALWLFLDAVGFKTVIDLGFSQNITIDYHTGLKILTGIATEKEVLGSTLTTTYTTFNFISLVTVLVALIGAAGVFMGKKAGKIGVLCLLVSAILMFLTPVFVPMFFSDNYKETVEKLGDAFSVVLATPAIISGVIMVLSAGVGAYASTLKK